MKERSGQAGSSLTQSADNSRTRVRVPPSREGKRVVSAYLDADLRRQFRQVAAAMDMSVQDLLEESVRKIIDEKRKALGLKIASGGKRKQGEVMPEK